MRGVQRVLRYDEALQTLLAVLDRCTLADLTRARRRLRGLLAD
jgi:hypothetical protein